jgi:hypothetical protein
MPVAMIAFSTTYSDMKLFNETVLEVSKEV